MSAPSTIKPKALAFDVFGTVVDWRTSITHEFGSFLAAIGRDDIDPSTFADAWRFRYISTMTALKDAGRPFVTLDVLHREMLDATLQAHDIDPATLDEAVSSTGIGLGIGSTPGPTRGRIIAPEGTLSHRYAVQRQCRLAAGNGTTLWPAVGCDPWGEFSRTYKPDPRAYLATASALAIAPDEPCWSPRTTAI